MWNIIISTPVIRSDNAETTATLNFVNKRLAELKIKTATNIIFPSKSLGKNGLHLNDRGRVKLAINYVS